MPDIQNPLYLEQRVALVEERQNTLMSVVDDLDKFDDKLQDKIMKLEDFVYGKSGDIPPAGSYPDVRLLPIDVTNSKLTYPDATEKNFPDFLTEENEFFRVQKDGSFRFRVPKKVIGTTPKAKFSRCEIRMYQSLANKTNWAFDDLLMFETGVVFHKLPDGNATFAQIHGESKKPYAEFVAEDDDIKILMGIEQDSDQDTVFKFGVKPQLEMPIVLRVAHTDGVLMARLYNKAGPIGVPCIFNVFRRTDSKYGKIGAYGPGEIDLTHFNPALLNNY